MFKLPDAGCYQQFFASSTPPTGLRGLNNANIKYICQTNKKQTKYFYSTMFDQGQGIAVVAAYRLGPLDVAFQKRQTFTWDPTPGKFFLHVYGNEAPSLVIFVSFSWIEVSSDTLYPQTMLAGYQLPLPQIIPLPLELKNNPVL